MPRSEVSSKNHASRGVATDHVSAPSYFLPKRPRGKNVPSLPSIQPLEKAWESFSSDIETALSDLREPSFRTIAESLSNKAPGTECPAVCVVMGASAAAGDRASIFDSILSHIHHTHDYSMLHLHSAHHDSLPTIAQHLDSLSPSEPTIVAVQDADQFSENVLRDLVYICGKRAETNPNTVSFVFGLGTSDDALHSALGIQEATMISPIVVEMPSALDCFNVIVEKVLSPRIHGLLIDRHVFEAIEQEFFSGEATVAMLIRSLRQIYTMHFFREPAAGVLCDPDHLLRDSITGIDKKRQEKRIQKLKKVLSDDELMKIQGDIESVSLSPEIASSMEEFRDQVISWTLQHARWQGLCTLVERVFVQLFEACEVETDEWLSRSSGYHQELRLHMLKEFLPLNNNGGAIGAAHFLKLILSKVEKAGRLKLIKILDCMITCINAESDQPDEEVSGFLSRMAHARKELEELNKNDNEEVGHVNKKPKMSTRRRAQGGAAAQRRRREQLLAGETEARRANTLSAPRKNVGRIIEDLYKSIKNLNSIPLHELFTYSYASELQKLSGGMGGMAEPRASVFSALRQPSKILGSIPANAVPDSTVAYKILSEGGRMVSLYDWYNSFATTKTAAMIKRDKDGNIELVNISTAEMQARFAKACSELEFLGLMKYTNRKTDHVLRLVFE